MIDGTQYRPPQTTLAVLYRKLTAGIGFMITVAGATFQTDKVFVGVLIFAISGMIGMELLTKLEQRFGKWRPQVGS